MKLISMVNFILEQTAKEFSAIKRLNQIISFAEFLKQPLKLEMFVPCGEDGNDLEEPKDWKTYESGGSAFMNIDEIIPCQDYKKAKEKVLFEGFPSDVFDSIGNESTIEDLLDDKYNTYFLTPTAIKQIGL